MKKIITFTFLIYFCSCKTDNKADTLNDSKTKIKQKTNTRSIATTKYVVAKSGLNYRKRPNDVIIGKFEYGEKLEIVRHTNVFENIKDDQKNVQGEWLGVKKDKDTVYVFGGYLSDNLNSTLYKWIDELCSYSSFYDSNIYSKEEIDNCYKIIHNDGYYHLANSPSVFKVSDIDDLNKDDLTKEYFRKINEIQKLKLPEEKTWQEHKENIIIYLNELYQVYSIRYDAYLTQDFKVLDKFWKSDTLLAQYSSALQGTDEELLDVWEKFTSRQAKKNGSPDRVWEEYRTMKNAQNWREQASVNIMTFGWWNAANKHINTYQGYKHSEDFLSLFISTKETGCDEP